MRALNAEIELSDTARVAAGAWISGMRPDSKLPEWGIAREYKNSGNEAKEYLKTKDITFFDAANCARFARRLAAFGPRKEQKSPRLAELKSGLATRPGDAATVTISRLARIPHPGGRGEARERSSRRSPCSLW